MDQSSIKQWWQQLNVREQRLVLALGSAVMVLLLYTLLWQPLNTNLANTEKKLVSRQALLTWVDENVARYQAIKPNGSGKKTSASLSSIINRTANQYQLNITRMQPQGESLQVWLDTAPFTQLLFWLEHLANNEGLQVQAIDLASSDKAGEVRVRRLQLTKQ
ncbi:general secretion pathway protein GspM [Colwellia sp. 39_35_sub15_T18]|nr:general secretion pathway protein GspM [Colwellia sp. 39_35_sub15_T18]